MQFKFWHRYHSVTWAGCNECSTCKTIVVEAKVSRIEKPVHTLFPCFFNVFITPLLVSNFFVLRNCPPQAIEMHVNFYEESCSHTCTNKITKLVSPSTPWLPWTNLSLLFPVKGVLYIILYKKSFVSSLWPDELKPDETCILLHFQAWQYFFKTAIITLIRYQMNHLVLDSIWDGL